MQGLALDCANPVSRDDRAADCPGAAAVPETHWAAWRMYGFLTSLAHLVFGSATCRRPSPAGEGASVVDDVFDDHAVIPALLRVLVVLSTSLEHFSQTLHAPAKRTSPEILFLCARNWAFGWWSKEGPLCL